MRKLISAVLASILLVTPILAQEESIPTQGPLVSAPSYVLMEKETGTVLLEQDANIKREPASVTKIMTLLLIMEALDEGRLKKDDMVTVSANAAGQGGSQVFLKEGEQFSVWELMKCITVVSGNDASVALAEHLCGSVESFVTKMNAKAATLGMENTTFLNCTGLPAEGHMTTPMDIAIMSRELISNHPDLRELTTIWMDSIRDGAFGLTNTNSLIRFYNGATGLKTGHTSSARFCMSATAEKEGMELIAVVMGAPTSANRFEDVKSLLDYGFSSYTLKEIYPTTPLSPVPVLLGTADQVQPMMQDMQSLLIRHGEEHTITTEAILAPNLEAPVELGQTLGQLEIRVNGELRNSVPLVASNIVPRLTTVDIFSRMMHSLFMAP